MPDQPKASPTTQDVKALYEEITYPGLDAKPNYHLVERLKPYLQGRKRVLDAGCGTGHLLVGLALSFPACHFFGIDLSENSIRIARELTKKYGVSAGFTVGDFSHDCFEEGNNGFDLIVLNGTLLCTQFPLESLTHLVKSLNQHGVMYLMLYSTRSHRARMELKEVLHLLEPNVSRQRFELYLHYLKGQDKSVLQTVLQMSPIMVYRFITVHVKKVLMRFTQKGVRSPIEIRYPRVYNQFYRDAFDVPIEWTYDTWSIRELLEGAGLEIVEHLGITRPALEWLPDAWNDPYEKLSTWEQARIRELLNPHPTSFSLIVKKKEEEEGTGTSDLGGV